MEANKSVLFQIDQLSSVTNQGLVRFMTYKGGMNAQMFIKFLKQLTKGAKTNIYIILDNLRVHHSKLVTAWAEKNKDLIQLFYLPSYSPEMNPDEYLNCDLKYGLAEKTSPKTDSQLKSNVLSHMRVLQKRPDHVKKYFRHPSINYAAQLTPI